MERPKDLPAWNFHKYLLGRDGHVADVFATAIEPTDTRVKTTPSAAPSPPLSRAGACLRAAPSGRGPARTKRFDIGGLKIRQSLQGWFRTANPTHAMSASFAATSRLKRSLICRAGTPPTTVYGATSRDTTAPRRKHGTVADVHTRKHNDRVSNPHIVADDDAIVSPIPEEGLIPAGCGGVILRTIGKAMQRRAVHGMNSARRSEPAPQWRRSGRSAHWQRCSLHRDRKSRPSRCIRQHCLRKTSQQRPIFASRRRTLRAITVSAILGARWNCPIGLRIS